ncbi:hypothetical protein Tco_0631668 [Tanacetum coccineum]
MWGELPSIIAFTFTTKSPKNTSLTNRASTLSNPNPVISLDFVEANYEVLESLLRKRRRSPRARRHRGRVVEFEDALNKDRSRVERESNDRRPSERRIDEGGIHRGNLPLLHVTHLGISENKKPL